MNPIPPSVSPNYRGEVNQPGRPDHSASFQTRLDRAGGIGKARETLRRSMAGLAVCQARHDRILVSWENA